MDIAKDIDGIAFSRGPGSQIFNSLPFSALNTSNLERNAGMFECWHERLEISGCCNRKTPSRSQPHGSFLYYVTCSFHTQ